MDVFDAAVFATFQLNMAAPPKIEKHPPGCLSASRLCQEPVELRLGAPVRIATLPAKRVQEQNSWVIPDTFKVCGLSYILTQPRACDHLIASSPLVRAHQMLWQPPAQSVRAFHDPSESIHAGITIRYRC